MDTNFLTDKSFVTNAVTVVFCLLGLVLPGFVGEAVLTMGLYAFSGAITNWMAIYMLFEKVPGFYGSGVIPSRFTEFRAGIRSMVMEQFFNIDNVNKVLASTLSSGPSLVDKLLPRVDFNLAFVSLVDVIMKSSFGTALAMFGGASRLEALREPFVLRMQEFLRGVGDDPQLMSDITGQSADMLLQRVEVIVDQRLEQMTPQLVKEVMEKMIQHHLGWLVVWGGVVGALMGLGVVVIQHFWG